MEIKIKKEISDIAIYGDENMALDLIFVIAGGILLLIGFVGTIVPVIPGAPLAWAGLLVSYFSSYVHSSIVLLVITGIFAVLVSVMDNIFPAMLTKQSGGSKAGIVGCTIGLLIGMFLGFPGILLGPFLGAFVGELAHNAEDVPHAFKAAFGTFKGFLLGTGLKMIVCAVFIWIFVLTLIK